MISLRDFISVLIHTYAVCDHPTASHNLILFFHLRKFATIYPQKGKRESEQKENFNQQNRALNVK